MSKREQSDVHVTFNDGEVKVYRISAGVGISRHLAHEARTTGVLSLWNGFEISYGIPLANIREWVIVPIPGWAKEKDNDDHEAEGG